MLYHLFHIEEKSKRSAFGISLVNIVFTLLLNALLITFGCLVQNVYEERRVLPLVRLVWVETAVNIAFAPFDVSLSCGIKKNKYLWIRSWILAKIIQAACTILLNSTVLFYVMNELTLNTCLCIIMYTIVVEVLYLETIVFMHVYQRQMMNSQQDDQQLPKKVPDIETIRF